MKDPYHVKNSTILIAGDSWGCGEWPQLYTGPKDILHPGLADYMKQAGYSVINISKGGASNRDILDQIRDFFDSGANDYLVSPITKILIFQTAWYRDFSPATGKIDFDESFLDVIDDQIAHRLTSKFYYELSAIAQKHGVRIFLIGGESDTLWLDNFSQEYMNVEIACQSFANLCINDSHRVADQKFSISSKAADFLRSRSRDRTLLAMIESMIDTTLEQQQTRDQNPEYFFPDGKHANRQAHKKLFDFLVDTEVI